MSESKVTQLNTGRPDAPKPVFDTDPFDASIHYVHAISIIDLVAKYLTRDKAGEDLLPFTIEECLHCARVEIEAAQANHAQLQSCIRAYSEWKGI